MWCGGGKRLISTSGRDAHQHKWGGRCSSEQVGGKRLISTSGGKEAHQNKWGGRCSSAQVFQADAVAFTVST